MIFTSLFNRLCRWLRLDLWRDSLLERSDPPECMVSDEVTR